MTAALAPDATPADAPVEARVAATSRPGRTSGRLYGVVAPLALVAVLLGLWEIASRNGWIDADTLSAPTLIWDELVELYRSGSLVDDGFATVKAMVYALAIGVPAGVAIGLALAALPRLNAAVGPLLVPLNSVPRIALAPLCIIWFGITTSSKVAVAVSLVVFITLFSARAGVKSVDPDMLTVSHLMGVPKHRAFLRVVLPASVPSIFAGIRLALTYSLLGVVATEMVAARDGLGVSIVRFGGVFNTSGVFAILLVLALMSSLLSVGLDLLERWLLRWQ